MPWIKKLNALAYVVAAITFGACVLVLKWPNSEIACTIERFQTLLTGSVAGWAALVTAGYVYRAAKLPIDETRRKEEERRIAMRAAGAAVLINAVNTIYMAVLHEVGKSANKRDGKLVTLNALPDLAVISTQKSDIIKELSDFFGFASALEATVGVNSNPDFAEDDDPKVLNKSLDELEKKRKSVIDKLATTVEGNFSSS